MSAGQYWLLFTFWAVALAGFGFGFLAVRAMSRQADAERDRDDIADAMLATHGYLARGLAEEAFETLDRAFRRREKEKP